mgnify:CR=1 FL=1
MKKPALAAAFALAAALSIAATSEARPTPMRAGNPLAQGKERGEAARPVVNKPAGVLRGCIIKRLIATDYHGKTYVRKVRVCG